QPPRRSNATTYSADSSTNTAPPHEPGFQNPSGFLARTRARTRRAVLATTQTVSDNPGVGEHPCCAALLHGGQRCRSAGGTGSEFRPHHSGLVAEHRAEALKRGEHLRARRKRVVEKPVIAETIETTTGNGAITVDPASVRPRLAEAAAESLDDIRRVLLE